MLLLFSGLFIVVGASTQTTGSSALLSSFSQLQKGWTQAVSKSDRWRKAREMVLREQAVEDYNGQYIASCSSTAQACRHRRLIALPLTDVFDPPMGVFSHGHVQTGDKMSLPSNFWAAIELNKAEVPWLYSVKRIEPEEKDDGGDEDENPLTTPPRVEFCSGDGKGESTETDSQKHAPSLHETVIAEQIPANTTLNQVIGGPLDYRAPASYVFLPNWMMRALGVRPGEIVQVDLITTTPPGSLAKFRPHSAKFAKAISNPQAVMETELRHYSSLTRGSTIAMDYNGQRYWFDVVDCRTPSSSTKGGGVSESVPFIKCQDCDIATDFLPDRETRREQARKRRERLQEQRQQAEA